jgi:hypothetical protein
MEQYEYLYGMYRLKPHDDPMFAFDFSVASIKLQEPPSSRIGGSTTQETNPETTTIFNKPYLSHQILASGPTEGLAAKLLAGGVDVPCTASKTTSTVHGLENQDRPHSGAQYGDVGVAPLKYRKLYVGKIPYDTTEHDLKFFFGNYQL